MILSMIVAMGKNRVIGKNNSMMWSIPSEYRHYRTTIQGHYFIIGRKNYEGSLETHRDQPALVLTRQQNYQCEHPTFSQLKDAVEYARLHNESECFVIGGEEIYRLALPFVSRLYLSVVDFNEPGEAYFPEHESYDWNVISKSHHGVSPNTPLSWDFVLLEKKPKSIDENS
jgi:dihydrofolate reductase